MEVGPVVVFQAYRHCPAAPSRVAATGLHALLDKVVGLAIVVVHSF